MRLSLICLSIAAILPTMSYADALKKDTDLVETSLDAVTVAATRTEKSVLQSAQAVNVISAEDVEKKLDSNLFDTLDMIPNVSASGGPRAAGHKFNIRGFSDAEDVLVTVDGMVQTFEKYRMGSLFTDPDLYRTISIKRGTSTVLHGGGALGGVVQLELKDAADFLTEDETAGAIVKLGYDSNNEQKNGSVYAFARPTESLDLLAAVIKRDGDDFELSNDETLDNSALKNTSLLFKGEYFLSEESVIGASFSQTSDGQRTEFNTTDPGAWGTVYRDVDQTSANVSYEFVPENNALIDLTMKLGFSNSKVTESDGEGQLADFVGIESNYEYNITTLDVMNNSRLSGHTLTYGVQYTDQERVGEKTALPCEQVDYETYRCVKYGDTPRKSEMTSHPGGSQKRTGVYLQDEFKLADLTIIAGVRYEHYKSSPTAQFAQQFDTLKTEVSHSDWAPAISLNYQVNSNFAVFANRQSGFRAPLLDELYDQYGGRQPALDLGLEYSDNTEVGVTFDAKNLITDNDSLTARFIYFDINVDDEITSVTSEAANPLPAPRYANRASNDRDGIEFELNFATTMLYTNLAYSNIDGEDHLGEPLWYLPADKLALNAGVFVLDNALRIGTQITQNAARDVQVYDRTTRTYTTQTQDSYALVDLYANWSVSEKVNLRVAVDNVFNKEYKLMAGTGGGIGDYGLGRNIKTQVSWRF
jgi:hemoglobin/transferrin/lactoferrin receptor protein